MCGIAGIVRRHSQSGQPPTLELLNSMAATLQHRGPDEFGIYRDELAGLAHSRLSIIDLSSGQQPLTNEDETWWIVFNGEIFNYVELRVDLEGLGHRFRTKSDTEVIIHAYEQWGDEAFAKFNGQFAIALWNNRTHTLVLARDWAGVRPLHYAETPDKVVFASEVKAIFADDTLPRRLDPIGLDETFTFWSIVPPQSVFEGLAEVQPGHVRTYENGGVRDVTFWNNHFPQGSAGKFQGSYEDATEAVRHALNEATRLRMVRADVPVGSYLSGGLDSSLVAALGLESKGTGFRTYSLRFEDVEYDETEYQRAMVQHIGSQHEEVMVSRLDIANIFPEVIRHTERPILRTAPAPMFLLSRLVRDSNMKVVLTGEGADEVFGGYDLFREAKLRRFWARQPESKCRPMLFDRLYPYLARSPVSQREMAKRFFGRNLENWQAPGFSHDMRWTTTESIRKLFTRELQGRTQQVDVKARLLGDLPREFSNWTFLAQDQYLEIRTLLAGYLLSSQGDRMLMANSVEGRFPFLDVNVVKLAHSLPDHFKLRALNEKAVLKSLGSAILPAQVCERKKQPYRAPDALSFVAQGAPPWIDDMMSSSTARAAGVFDPVAIEGLWKKCKTRAASGQFSNTDNMAVCAVLSTHLLHNQFVATVPFNRTPVRLVTCVDRLSKG